MSQTRHQYFEGGGNPGPVNGHRDQPHMTRDRGLRSSQRKSGYGDSSWPLYSMYSKIAEKEDNKIVEYSQKDIDGILIFTGLFSATVGAFLTVSLPDLKPNSQDTSAFYLENIYQLFGNSNVSIPSNPSALAKPPAFSPPSYVIWVNSLWFLSLLVSLSCATAAMLSRDCGIRYMSISRSPDYAFKEQARIRAIFAKVFLNPDFIHGTSAGPFFLHLSLLLFIIGAVIYLFNINRAVFYAVVWWVVAAAILYTILSLVTITDPEVLFHTPLSPLVLSIYLGITYVVFQICSYIPLHGFCHNTRRHYHDLSKRFNDGLVIGKRREAEEIASKPSSEIDALILERILLNLDEDHTVETFFDAIPGFCSSKSCTLPFSLPVQTKLRQAMVGFLDRTFSSCLISESARTGRLITCLNATHAALEPYAVSGIFNDILNGHWDEALKSVEIGHALRRWGHSRDYDLKVRQIIACIIAGVRRRDDRWSMLVTETFGVPDCVLQDYLAHGDSVLLSILIHISREANRTGTRTSGILSSLSRFDIRAALPELQHNFCTLWNEISREARNDRWPFSTPARILNEIRHLYDALHQGTDAVPTPHSTSTDSLDSESIQYYHPPSYPLCDIAGHRPDSTTHVRDANTVPPPTQLGDSPDPSLPLSTPDFPTALRLAEEANVITGLPSPPDPSTASEIGETSLALIAVHSSSPPLDRSPQDDVSMAQPDTTLAIKLSRPLESNNQQSQTAPYIAPLAETSGVLSTTPTPAPVSTSPPILNRSSVAHDASPAPISKSLLPTSSVDPSALNSPLPPHLLPFSNAELLSLLSGTSPKGPSNNATVPYLRTRSLVNDENMCPANAVLQLLVRCPPFWDMVRELDQSMGHREGGETGGQATPLMYATVRFLDEFSYKEKSFSTHQQVERGTVRENKDGNEEDDGTHSFLSTYVYDAMKEKRQSIVMRDGLQQDAAVFLCLYLEALDEELVTLRLQPRIGAHKSASTSMVDGLEKETQSGEGQTEVGTRDHTANSVKSPISRIFGGRSCSTVRAPNQLDTFNVEDWRSLQLNIQPDSVHTIQDALAHFSQPQPVQVGQSSSSEGSKQVLLEALPPVLVLHLKRFYDAATDGINNINKLIHFTPELEIPLENMAPDVGKSAEPVNYKLYGVLYHHGESAGSGHYTVDVLHPNRGSGSGEAWMHIDDEGVSAVQHEDVFGGYDSERVDDRCAYMLFYCRTAPTQT